MNPRYRRLKADYEKVRTEFAGNPYIKVKVLEGNPPEKYKVSYRLKGLKLDYDLMRPIETDWHEVEIYLHNEYPREKPRCTMLTEIFHPNIGTWVCLSDYWAAGSTLMDIILEIGQLIQYQLYNPKSPLNAEAAKWVEENSNLFPIGNVELTQPEPEIFLSDPRSTKKKDESEEIDIVLIDKKDKRKN